MNKQLSAGSIVETQCTRCRRIMNHTIVAMVGTKIVRVECNTCHGMHAYHAAKVPKEPVVGKDGQKKPAVPRKTKSDPEATARAEWEELKPTLNQAQAIPYDMNRVYKVKNLLLHPLFGLGVVQAVLPPNKMDVLFQDGKKRLRCG